jgi:hypothetical protein
MRTSIGIILIVVVIGIVIAAVVRVLTDAVAWYKDQMMDPYRDLRKKSKDARKAKRATENAASNDHAVPSGRSDDNNDQARIPAGFE